MAISITDIEMGMGLLVEGQVYRVVEYHHVKPAKGSAFVRIKLKHLKNESVLERTYRSAEKLDDAIWKSAGSIIFTRPPMRTILWTIRVMKKSLSLKNF